MQIINIELIETRQKGLQNALPSDVIIAGNANSYRIICNSAPLEEAKDRAEWSKAEHQRSLVNSLVTNNQTQFFWYL